MGERGDDEGGMDWEGDGCGEGGVEGGGAVGQEVAVFKIVCVRSNLVALLLTIHKSRELFPLSEFPLC